MSLGVGLISLGAAYKSSTAVKAVGYSEGKTEEQLKVDVGEGITLEKGGLSADVDETKVDSKDIKDIIERLGRIEKQQVEHGKGSEQHLLIGLGFSSVVIGSTFIITTSNFGGGISIILAGIGVVLVAYFGKPFRKR